MKTFEYDLALPVHRRLAPIFIAFEDKIDTFVEHIDKLLGPYKVGLSVLGAMQSSIEQKALHRDELQYISEHTGLSFMETLFMQLIYETSSACTTGINNNFYLRTMDWEMPFLKDYTIQLNVTRSGVPLCQAITWLGYVGFMTAWNESSLVAVNYRRTAPMSILSLYGNVQRLASMNWPVGYLVREVMTSNKNLRWFHGAPLVSPCYITVLDFKKSEDSKVIVRDPTKCVHTRTSDDGLLVQTNCDMKNRGENILYSFERITSFETLDVEESDTVDSLLEKVLVFPVKNDATIYYWAMYAGEVRVDVA